jgi:hypothetical protein
MPRKPTSAIAKTVRNGRPKAWPRGYWTRLSAMKADFKVEPLRLTLLIVET